MLPEETPMPASTPRRVNRITRALAHRNYRLFFGGQSVSLMGTWITRIATSWLVYRLTGSAFLLGVVGFCGQIPTLLLAPFAGVLVDRRTVHRRHHHRRRRRGRVLHDRRHLLPGRDLVAVGDASAARRTP